MKWPHSWQQKKMVPRSVYRRVKKKVALNSVSFHGKVTNQNDTQHIYCLIVNWQFSFIQHLAFRKCLQLVQNIYSKWPACRFRHFSNSTKGVFFCIAVFSCELFGWLILFVWSLCSHSMICGVCFSGDIDSVCYTIVSSTTASEISVQSIVC